MYLQILVIASNLLSVSNMKAILLQVLHLQFLYILSLNYINFAILIININCINLFITGTINYCIFCFDFI